MSNSTRGIESGVNLPEIETTFPDWWYRVSDICRDYPAIIQGDRVVTYKEMEERSNQFANALLARGYKKGTKIAVWFPSIPEFEEALFGAMKIGAISMASSIAPMHPDDVKVELINNYDADILLTHESVLDHLEKLRPKLNVKAYIMAGSKKNIPDYAIHYESMMDESPETRPKFDWKIKPEDTAYTLFSGGTTGVPKIIDHRQASIPGTYPRVINRTICEKMLPKLLKAPEEKLKKLSTLFNSPYDQIFLNLLKFRSTDPEYVMGIIRSIFDTPEYMAAEILPYLFRGKMKLIAWPLWTSWGFYWPLYSYYCGGCIILGQKIMDVDEWLSLIEKHKANMMTLAYDPYHKAFIDAMSEGKYDISSLVACTGTATTLIKRMMSLLPQSCLTFSMITSSEPTITGFNILYDEDEDIDKNAYYLPPYTIIFNTEKGRVARPGETGSTITAGRYCLKGYEKIEKKEDWIEYDGRSWFRDGLVGTLDEEGKFCISAAEYTSKTETIRGRSVDVKKVELTILGDPKVDVVGCLPDEKGENLIAVVEKKPGITITRDDIENLCRKDLKEHEVPTEILIVEPGTLPRTRYNVLSYGLLGKFLREKGYKVK